MMKTYQNRFGLPVFVFVLLDNSIQKTDSHIYQCYSTGTSTHVLGVLKIRLGIADAVAIRGQITYLCLKMIP